MHQPASVRTEPAKQTAPLRERYLGVSYWMELVDGDSEHKRVTTDQVFRHDDRLQLNILSNLDGYLYVVNLASTGHSQVLFPHSAVSAG